MNVLITGGTGFIGSRLALRCLDDGERVRVLAQRNTPAERQNCQELENRGIEVVDGSVTDADATRRACAGMDVVYHLAAAQHEANVPDQHYFDVNVEGTRHMLDAAVAAGVKRFVHGSTIGVYGISRNGPVQDDSPLEPDNIYGITKLEGEKLVKSYFDKLSIAIVRISEAYGPGDRRLLKLFKGIAKGRFFHIGKGQNLHHVVYIDDLIEGLRLAATQEQAVGRTCVLAGPKAITTDDMVAGISKALGSAGPKLRVPMWPMMTTAAVMEGTLRPLGIQPPLHRRRMNFFVKSFKFSGDAARQALGYEPKVDFEEGARRVAEWYRHKGMLNGVGGGNGTGHDAGGGSAHGGHSAERPIDEHENLTAKMECFDSFWEGPENVDKGYGKFGQFYRVNYLPHAPADKAARILVVSCGPGYFVNLLRDEGYTNVTGIDAYESKIVHAKRHDLNCHAARAKRYLEEATQPYDLIFCEQELNHLTKEEMVAWLKLCHSRLADGGSIIVHGLNGANPLVGSETLAQNFDHYNTFTEYSLRQVLDYSGFKKIHVYPLHLYVFYKNPMNYVAWGVSSVMSVIFRVFFILYGKSNKLFTKKIAAVAFKQA